MFLSIIDSEIGASEVNLHALHSAPRKFFVGITNLATTLVRWVIPKGGSALHVACFNDHYKRQGNHKVILLTYFTSHMGMDINLVEPLASLGGGKMVLRSFPEKVGYASGWKRRKNKILMTSTLPRMSPPTKKRCLIGC